MWVAIASNVLQRVRRVRAEVVRLAESMQGIDKEIGLMLDHRMRSSSTPSSSGRRGAPAPDSDAKAYPGWAQAYLEARAHTARDRWVEVLVLRHTRSRAIICYGPPEKWPAGAALRVLNDEYTLDVVRCADDGLAGPGAAAEEDAALTPLSDMGRGSISAGTLSRLKVGVHAHRGGCAYMEDEALVHVTPTGDAAFVCVYDGHGGGEASKYCKEVRGCLGLVQPASCASHPSPARRQILHVNVMNTGAYGRAMYSQHAGQADAEAEQALLDGFLQTDDELLARQLGQMQLAQQEQVDRSTDIHLSIHLCRSL